jgi:hypothetical protein
MDAAFFYGIRGYSDPIKMLHMPNNLINNQSLGMIHRTSVWCLLEMHLVLQSYDCHDLFLIIMVIEGFRRRHCAIGAFIMCFYNIYELYFHISIC